MSCVMKINFFYLFQIKNQNLWVANRFSIYFAIIQYPESSTSVRLQTKEQFLLEFEIIKWKQNHQLIHHGVTNLRLVYKSSSNKLSVTRNWNIISPESLRLNFLLHVIKISSHLNCYDWNHSVFLAFLRIPMPFPWRVRCQKWSSFTSFSGDGRQWSWSSKEISWSYNENGTRFTCSMTRCIFSITNKIIRKSVYYYIQKIESGIEF